MIAKPVRAAMAAVPSTTSPIVSVAHVLTMDTIPARLATSAAPLKLHNLATAFAKAMSSSLLEPLP